MNGGSTEPGAPAWGPAGPSALPSQVFEVTRARDGMRLDRFVQAEVPKMSRAAVHAALAEQRVELDSGRGAKASRRVRHGERVVVKPRRASGARQEPPRVLASGEGWCVVDKPPGLACVPSARHPGRDVVSLTGRAPAHRLDRFTSGCLLLTSKPRVARHFFALFRDGGMAKEYAAVVRGLPKRATWTCRAPVGPDLASRVPGKMRACPEGRPAETSFELVATCREGGGRALVRACPRTGRRHQVRLHASASGHPLVGDLLYGGDERDFVRLQLGRLSDRATAGGLPGGSQDGRFLLHARALRFVEPEGRTVEVEAPWPADFPLALVCAWR